MQLQKIHDPSRVDRSAVNAAIFCDPPHFFWPSILLLLKHTLNQRCRLCCMGDEEEDSEMQDNQNPVMFEHDNRQLYQNLRTLGWLPNLLSRSIGHILYEAIQEHTLQQVKGNYNEEGLLDILMNWKETVLLPWIQDRFGFVMLVKQKFFISSQFFPIHCQLSGNLHTF